MEVNNEELTEEVYDDEIFAMDLAVRVDYERLDKGDRGNMVLAERDIN